MRDSSAISHEKYPDPHHDVYSRTTFGFWLFLLTDFMLFGTLFAAYAVLHKSTFGGPPPKELFHLHTTYIQTYVLLFSTFTIGLAGAATHRRNKRWTIALYAVTFALGIIFAWMEFGELVGLVKAGNSWEKNAYLSVFFTLIGTHGGHILFGLLWIIVLLIPVCMQGITSVSIRRLTCMKMFWQFLNVIWVFIFTVVYLLGAT